MNKIKYMDVPIIPPVTIPPPQPAPQAALNQGTQNNAPQVQQQQTQAINQIPLGITVGQVAGNDKNGNLIVRLAGSDLVLSSPIALAKDALVTLKIDNISSNLAVQLLSVDGKTPASQPQALSNQLQQNPPKDQNQNSQNQFQQNQNGSVPLKLVSILNSNSSTKPAEPPAPQPNQAQPAQVYKTDTVTLTSPQTTAVKGIIITLAPEAVQNLKANLPFDEGDSAKLADSIPEEIKPGTQVNAKITSIAQPPQNPNQQVQTENKTLAKQDWMQPEQQALKESADEPNAPQVKLQEQADNFTPTLRPLSNGNIQMNARVLDAKPNGEMLVETKIGKILISSNPQISTAVKGAILKLELTNFSPPEKADIELPSGDQLPPAQQLGHDWPALKTLAERADELGMPQLTNQLAGIDSAFAGRLAGFINAMKTGDLKAWLGENAYDLLDDGDSGSNLLAKLRGDINNIRDIFNQRDNGWQTMLFPVYDGNSLYQARMHVKYLPDEETGQPDKASGTRFIVEVDTSHFGEIQLDGLVRGNMTAKHFDLMVRTHKNLELNIQDDIRNIFSSAGEITGFHGDIEFSTMKEFPVNLFDKMVNSSLAKKIDHKGIEA